MRSFPFSLFFSVQLLFLVLLVFAPPVHSQIQQAWVAHYNNGITNGQHRALKMALGTDGNIYECGFSQNATSNLDYAVWKYAPNGNLLWVGRYGSTNNSLAKPTGFALDPGNNSFVTGTVGTISFDVDGNGRWLASYPGLAVATDLSSNCFVTGFGSNFDTVKLSPQGTNTWLRQYVDVGPGIGQTICVDTQGEVYVAGSDVYRYYQTSYPTPHDVPITQLLGVKYSANGTEVWHSGYSQFTPTGVSVEASTVDLAGGFFVSFDWAPVTLGAFLVAKFDSGGSPEWVTQDPTGNGGSRTLSLRGDASDKVFVTGQDAAYPPLPSYATYKIDTNGAFLWTNLYPVGFVGSSFATSLALDSADDVYITGSSPTETTSNDIVTIAYDTNGKQLWLQRYDGPAHGDDEGNAIAVDNNGNVYVAGFDTPIGGGTEMVLIKYSPVTARHEANGDFQLQAQGAANEPFDIQASTNLESWIDLGDFDADTNGLLQFVDTNAGLYPSRFYVAKPQ